MKHISIILSIFCLMLTACNSSKVTNTSPYPDDPEFNSLERVKVRKIMREQIRNMNLEIVYRGEAHWPSQYANLSVEEELEAQKETMDQIRNGEGFWIIPLTKEQVHELEQEGCFASIDTSIKKSATK